MTSTTTTAFVRPSRTRPAALATGEIAVAAPPQPPHPESGRLAARLLPVVMAVTMISMMAVVYRSGAAATRNPVFLIFPLTMLVSVVGTAMTARDRRRGIDVDADRDDYLAYLGGLREAVTDTAAAQRSALAWCHPPPDALWTLVGEPRMWERRAGDADFGQVRIGVGSADLATPLLPPQRSRADRVDPVTDSALRYFLCTHTTVPDVPAPSDWSNWRR